MFQDYSWMNFLYEKRRNDNTSLGFHLDWLLQRGEDRIPQAICPQCKQQRIKYFSVRFSSYKNTPSFDEGYTYCQECLENCYEPRIQLFKFKWSNILKISAIKSDQKNLYKLYRWAFVLPTRLSNEIVFEFFADKFQSPDALYL